MKINNIISKSASQVNIKHFYGDQLWAAGSREQLPDLGPPDLDFSVKVDCS